MTSKDDARSCGDTEILRARVAEKLGRDPFTAEASSGDLRVSFAREKQSWTAEIPLLDDAGKRTGARTLSARARRSSRSWRRWSSLSPFSWRTWRRALRRSVPHPLQLPAPLDEPGPAPAPDAPPLPHSCYPPPPSPHVDAALGATGAVGVAPAPALSGEIAVRRFRVESAGRLHLPASSQGDVAVRTRLVHGRIAPCYGWRVLSACFVAAVGSVSGKATGDRVASSHPDCQLLAAGGIGALSRPFVVRDRGFVRASVDLLFGATRVGFEVGDQRVWTLPLVSAAGVVGIGARLP